MKCFAKVDMPIGTISLHLAVLKKEYIAARSAHPNAATTKLTFEMGDSQKDVAFKISPHLSPPKAPRSRGRVRRAQAAIMVDTSGDKPMRVSSSG